MLRVLQGTQLHLHNYYVPFVTNTIICMCVFINALADISGDTQTATLPGTNTSFLLFVALH